MHEKFFNLFICYYYYCPGGWGGGEGGFYLTRSMLFNFVSKMEMSC
jgi:hypothetical protein